LSPQARAYALLQGINFGPDLDRSYHLDSYRAGGNLGPHIQFRWTGGDRFIRWVTASDLVALSLLQANQDFGGRLVRRHGAVEERSFAVARSPSLWRLTNPKHATFPPAALHGNPA
jgi:hypothetical protein